MPYMIVYRKAIKIKKLKRMRVKGVEPRYPTFSPYLTSFFPLQDKTLFLEYNPY